MDNLIDSFRWQSTQSDQWRRIMDRIAKLEEQYADDPDKRYVFKDVRRRLDAKWKAARTDEERDRVLIQAAQVEQTLKKELGHSGIIKWIAIGGGALLLLYLLDRK